MPIEINVYSPTRISATEENGVQCACFTEGRDLVPEEVGLELRSGDKGEVTGWPSMCAHVCICLCCVFDIQYICVVCVYVCLEVSEHPRKKSHLQASCGQSKHVNFKNERRLKQG